MAIWYVDPEGGNDANGGTSFANRVKSMNAFTPAAGDSVRIIASPPPWSIGSATWTNKNGNVTLASAVTQTLDNMQATTGWVAGANVTISTTSSYRRYGSAWMTFALSSSFVSGALIAYKPVSSLNLSAFSCLSCLFGWSTTPQSTTNISIALCSDSAGAVPIVTLPGDQFMAYTSVQSVANLFENGGSALPSGINSIAIYASGSVKPFSSSGTIYMGNLIACTAVHSANHLSHNSVIGKNTTGEPEWYSIQYIDGTTVNLGAVGDYSASAGSRVYYGTTETVTTYAMVGLRTRYTSTTYAIKSANGTPTSPITWTGGWDRTSMSSQTGQSWLNGQRVGTYFWYNSPGGNWHTFPDSTIGGISLNSSYPVNFGLQAGRVLKWVGLVDCSTFWSSGSNAGSDVVSSDYALDFAAFCDKAITLASESRAFLKMRVRRITGSINYGVYCTQMLDERMSDIEIGQIDTCSYGVSLGSFSTYVANLRLRGTTFANNTYDLAPSSLGALMLDRPTFPATPSINGSSTMHGVYMTAVGGNRWDNRVYRPAVTQTADQSTTHGSTSQSVKINVASYGELTGLPYRTRLMRVAALSGKTVTVTCWAQRSDSTNLSAGLSTLQGDVAGVVDASVAASAASNTWEQLSISFTPTEDGVVDVFGYVGVPTNSSSANNQNVWFGDMAVTST